MEQFFKLKERGTSVRTEMIAGMTTFFAMVYILMVNANMFANPFGDGSNPLGVTYSAIYIATAISAIVGTTLAGFMSNLPLAMASGMGLNAFFVYTVCIGFGLFIALLGLENAGIVVPNSSTCVDLGSFNLLTQSWGGHHAHGSDSVYLPGHRYHEPQEYPWRRADRYSGWYGTVLSAWPDGRWLL